jgi:hypothetical protein
MHCCIENGEPQAAMRPRVKTSTGCLVAVVAVLTVLAVAEVVAVVAVLAAAAVRSDERIFPAQTSTGCLDDFLQKKRSRLLHKIVLDETP